MKPMATGMKIMARQVWKYMVGAAVAITVAVPAEEANAQAVERYQQGIERTAPRQVTLTPRDQTSLSTDETELLPSLNGVVITDTPAAAGGSGAGGVEVLSDDVPPGVADAARAYLNRPVSLASLDRMTRDMVLAFRAAGRPVVNVVIPPQDITNGVVQVIAVIGRVGETTVTGNARMPEYYTEGFTLNRGDVVEEGAVLDQLRWKSRRGHRQVNAVYSPGANFSETDIEFRVEEDGPFSVFFGADNTGSVNSVGEYRFFGGFTIADLIATDHELAYQYTTSEDGNDALGAHVVSYIFPLPFVPRTDIQITGAHVTSGMIVGPGFSSGESHYIAVTGITQLPHWVGISWDARYGFEYKNSDSTFEFGGIPVINNETDVNNFFLNVLGQRGDARSHTTFSLGVWVSPGNMLNRNTDAIFHVTRSNSSADYAYFRGSVEHTIYFGGWMASIELAGQVATDRLHPSEMMYIGGMNTVRGFEENALRGDHGFVGRFEVHTPRVSILELVNMANGVRDGLRLYGFFDVGVSGIEAPANATDVATSIAGAGVGVTYQIEDNLLFEAAYGWEVDDNRNLSPGNGEAHFRVVNRFRF